MEIRILDILFVALRTVYVYEGEHSKSADAKETALKLQRRRCVCGVGWGGSFFSRQIDSAGDLCVYH